MSKWKFKLGAGAAMVALLSAMPSLANQAGDILQQMGNTYKNAKTYQARIIQRVSGKSQQGQPFTTTITRQIRFQSPNRFLIQESAEGTGAAAKVHGGQTVVSDGKSMVIYAPTAKKYQRRPVPPTVSLPQLFALMRLNVMPQPNISSASLLADTSVGGHPAYNIVVKPTLRGGVPAAQRAQAEAALKKAKPIHVAIEKNSNTLLLLDQTLGTSAIHIEMSGQQVNGALGDNAFNFAIPAGATEVKASPGGMPGQPGAPGGAR